jgi:hypothetical protein
MMAAWEKLAMSIKNSLAASMPRTIQNLCDTEGNRINY